MTDPQIISLLARKDEEALVLLRDRYEVYCLTIARRLLRDEQAAEECVSDVWLAVWRSETVPRDLLDELAECIPDPLRSREADSTLLRGVMNDFVRALDENERALFVGRYWYGYTVPELAAMRGWTESRVSACLARQRKKLRKRLEKEGYTP